MSVFTASRVLATQAGQETVRRKETIHDVSISLGDEVVIIFFHFKDKYSVLLPYKFRLYKQDTYWCGFKNQPKTHIKYKQNMALESTWEDCTYPETIRCYC